MCLLLGCSGVGKTLLLKRLNACSNRGSYSEVGEAPSTIPTVGTNLVNMVTSNKKQEITIRELGGVMAPIWQNYYKDCDALMFMVDLSNPLQVSAACIQLLDVLTHARLQATPILLILNKTDVPSAMPRAELEQIIRLQDILDNAKQKVTVRETSAREGHGLHDIAKWIQLHAKPNQPS